MNTLMKTLMVGAAVVSLAGPANAVELSTQTNADARTSGHVQAHDLDVDADVRTQTRDYTRRDMKADIRSQNRSRTAGAIDTQDGAFSSNTKADLDVDVDVDTDTHKYSNRDRAYHANERARVHSSTNSRVATYKDYSDMTRAEIRNLQAHLNYAGYKLSVDGIAGARTRNALRNFQADNNLKATGRLDANTFAHLNSVRANTRINARTNVR